MLCNCMWFFTWKIHHSVLYRLELHIHRIHRGDFLQSKFVKIFVCNKDFATQVRVTYYTSLVVGLCSSGEYNFIEYLFLTLAVDFASEKLSWWWSLSLLDAQQFSTLSFLCLARFTVSEFPRHFKNIVRIAPATLPYYWHCYIIVSYLYWWQEFLYTLVASCQLFIVV